ncbi:MAG TPA: DUF3341 domain-containing protein [Opitutaceae bacterium]|nr:DUF3341 domain-containing protein [Opitutaceae bacterium]
MSAEETAALAGRFAEAETFAAAVKSARAAGYTRLEAYMPFAVEGVADEVAGPRRTLPAAMLTGGVLSAVGAFFLQEWATHDYPIDVAGRPLNSWPAFVPITFELMVLGASLVGIFTFFWLAGFPRLHHRMFAVAGFVRASQDRFFLCIRADDPLWADTDVRAFLADAGAEAIEEVRP